MTREEEAKIVDWLVTSAQCGCGRSGANLKTIVQEVLNGMNEKKQRFSNNNKPSDQWVKSFLERHPEIKYVTVYVLNHLP